MNLTSKMVLVTILALLGATIASASPASERLTREGVALFEAKQYNDAMTKFEQAVRDDPRDATALFHQAKTANRIGMHKWALRDLDAAIKLGATSDDLDFEYGWALLEARQFEPAAERLEAYDATHPARSDVNLLLARAYQAIGRFDDARARLEKAELYDPSLKPQIDAMRETMEQQSLGTEATQVAQRDQGIQYTRIYIALAGWIVIVLVIFKTHGPHVAILVSVIGGYALLPGTYNVDMFDNLFRFNRWRSIGITIVLGVLLFDIRRLKDARPRWFDAAVVLYCISPAFSLIANDFEAWQLTVSRLFGGFTYVAVPYIAGRLYFADSEKQPMLAHAVIIGGLLMAIICIYEMSVGPHGYLLGLIYGLSFSEHMVGRLGGWRPEGLVGNGIELSVCLAITTIVGLWMSLAKRDAQKTKIMMIAATVCLAIVTLLCRGVYGYAILALGVVATIATIALRARVAIVLLMLIAPIYIGLRYTGAWDGSQMIDLAQRIQPDRVGSLQWRIDSANEHVALVNNHDRWFGFGQMPRKVNQWPDGRWVDDLGIGGLVGMIAWLFAFHLLPLGLALRRLRGAEWNNVHQAAAWALTMIVVLDLINSLHNSTFSQITPLAGGALAGWATSKTPRPSIR